MAIRARKYAGPGLTNLKGEARGESEIIKPTKIINKEVKIRNLLGLLSKKGIFPVRIIWITRVWVQRDSRNHPVWNTGAEA